MSRVHSSQSWGSGGSGGWGCTGRLVESHKFRTLAQCWSNAGPASPTLTQHYASIGLTFMATLREHKQEQRLNVACLVTLASNVGAMLVQHAQTLAHRYPIVWRCHTEMLLLLMTWGFTDLIDDDYTGRSMREAVATTASRCNSSNDIIELQQQPLCGNSNGSNSSNSGRYQQQH